MIKLKKGTKLFVIVLILMLSVFFSYKFTHLGSILGSKSQALELNEPIEMFNESSVQKKVKVSYLSKDHKLTLKEVNKVIADFNLDTVISMQSNNVHSMVLQGSLMDFNEIIGKLRSLEGLEVERIFKNPNFKFDIDVDEHIQNKIATKIKLKDMMEKSSLPDRVKEFNAQLQKVQTSIDSLRSSKIKQSELKNDFIVNINIAQLRNIGLLNLSIIKSFLFTFLASLFGMFVLFLIFYYFAELFLKMMKLVGIGTSHGTTGYQYNRHKKVKRVYKKDEE